MKKTLICMAIAVTAMLGTTVFAEKTATYNDGIVTSDATGVKTVLITDSDGGLCYANQAEFGTTLDAATGFMMKKYTPAGVYTLSLGYADALEAATAVDRVTFEVVNTFNELPVAVLTGDDAVIDNGDGTYNTAFKADSVVLAGYNSLVFTFADNGNSINMVYPLSELDIPTISGDGAITLAIQLNNVPEKYKGNVLLCFSTYEVEGGMQ